MPEFDDGYTEISFDPQPDEQELIAHIALENGLTKHEFVTGRIVEEYPDIGWLYFYYKGKKIDTHKKARKHKIVEITLKRTVRIGL